MAGRLLDGLRSRPRTPSAAAIFHNPADGVVCRTLMRCPGRAGSGPIEARQHVLDSARCEAQPKAADENLSLEMPFG